MSNEFNITARGDSRDEIFDELDVQSAGQQDFLPAEFGEALRELVANIPIPVGGYIQLTTYGTIERGAPSNIIVNLSSHAPV